MRKVRILTRRRVIIAFFFGIVPCLFVIGCVSTTSTLDTPGLVPKEYARPYEAVYKSCLGAIETLGWTVISSMPESGVIRARTPATLATYGDDVVVNVTDGFDNRIRVNASSSTGQAIDYGKNKQNIERFFFALDVLVAQHRDGKEDHAATEQGPEAKRPVPVPRVHAGTGFFITSDGYLVTAAHVVAKCSKFTLIIETSSAPAKLVSVDAENDLAILKTDGKFSALPIGESGSVKLGADVFTIGYPNVAVQGTEPKYTRGEINALAGIGNDPRYFQVSIPVNPGNSGGPVVDRHGCVIGVIVTRLDDLAILRSTGALPQNVNYGIKASYLRAFVDGAGSLGSGLVQADTYVNTNYENLVEVVRKSTVIVLAE